MTELLTHDNLRTPGKRRAPQRHARRLAAVAGWVPSPNYSSRNGTTVTGVVIHTAEGPTDADSLGEYFGQAKVQVSSHVGIDDEKRVNYVDPKFEAWTLRNGNPWTDNLEMCGFASWTRAQWLQHPGMIQQAADWVAERCHARNVPPRQLTVADIAAGRRSGYFAHWDYTRATGDGTHWDVGTGFPWDLFAPMVQAAYSGTSQQEGLLMALTDAQQDEVYRWIRDLSTINPPYTSAATPTQLVLGDIFVNARRGAANKLDPTALAAALAKLLPSTSAPSEADLETALRKVFGSLDNPPS
ncbi:MAG TPA: N-acetylmuramoyl-L-alanine amidase [Spirillospora sp.]|nr:N-acetylmuramoyl-L-alanine amidase [Spirillospora sp.]